LLIGDPDPFDKSDIGDNVGAVPMKMTWLNGSGDDSGAYPTDFYYGELTDDWDADGDGWAAEVEDDGVLEFGAELLVGRIPSEDVETIDSILERTISYEQQSESPPEVRSSGVLACSFLDFETDGAYLGEQLLDGPFSDAGLTGRPMYQDGSAFLSWRYLEDGSLPSEWSNEEFGLVVWMGHGYSTGTLVGVPPLWIEGELMSTGSVSMLEASAPSFIIQLSCLNAIPEVSDNLAHELIKNQAVSTIAASRVSYYLEGKTSFGDNIDIGSIGYSCASNHVGQSPAGVPMSLYRYYLFDGNPGSGNWKVMNLLTFNLYGDPSLAYVFE